MKHAFHQFLWQIRRRPVLLGVHAALWFLVTFVSWNLTDGLFYFNTGAAKAHLALLALTILLTLDCAATDPAAGTDTFWRTRPPRWRAVWLGKVLFVILFLAGPAILCWLVDGLMLDFTAAQWRRTLIEPVVIVSLLLIFTALRGLARGWTASLVVFGVAGVLIHSSGALVAQFVARKWRWYSGFITIHDYYWVRFWLLMALVPGIIVLTTWALALRRRIPAGLIVGAAVLLVAAPYLFWRLFQMSARTRFSVTSTPPGEQPRPGDLPLGIITLRGVPQNHDAVVDEWEPPRDLIGQAAAVSGDPRSYHSVSESRSWGFYPGMDAGSRSTTPAWFTATAAARLQASLPPDTRWYSDGTGVFRNPVFGLNPPKNPPPQPLPIILAGNIVGNVFLPGEAFRIPLQAGATAAKNGTRITVDTVTPGSQNLEFSIILRQVREPVRLSSSTIEDVFVLHLPAVPCALVLNRDLGLDFVALAAAGAKIQLRASMPDAEFTAGTRFTPETLRDAALWHYRAAASIPFEADTWENNTLPPLPPPGSP